MKTVLQIFVSLVASLVVFLAAGLAIVAVELALHGDSLFEHDTQADAALGLLILVISLPVAIATFLFVMAYLHNREKRAAEPDESGTIVGS